MKVLTPDVDTTRLTLTLPVSVVKMIKSDAKAIGMTPSGYLSMAARLLNDTAEEQAKGAALLATAITESVTDSLKKEGVIR